MQRREGITRSANRKVVLLVPFLLSLVCTPLAWAQEHGGGGGGHAGGSGCSSGSGGHGGKDGGHSAGGTSGSAKAGHESGVHGSAASARGFGGRVGASGGRHVPESVTVSPSDCGPGVPTESAGRAGLARLNAARALVAPGFDPSRIASEEESPIHHLALYQEELAKPDPNLSFAAERLGDAATRPVSVSTVQQLNSLIGVNATQAQAEAIAADAEARRLTNKESHGGEEGHDEGTSSHP